MPIKPKKSKIKRNDLNPTILNEARYDNLTSQMEFILNGDIFPSLEDREKCYWANKKEILGRWFADPRNYCERPLCWWQFEELSPRLVIGHERWFNPIDHNPGEWEISPIEEQSPGYLFRLGLLKECEMDKYQKLEIERITITQPTTNVDELDQQIANKTALQS
jgi:hypothetical protein